MGGGEGKREEEGGGLRGLTHGERMRKVGWGGRKKKESLPHFHKRGIKV